MTPAAEKGAPPPLDQIPGTGAPPTVDRIPGTGAPPPVDRIPVSEALAILVSFVAFASTAAFHFLTVALLVAAVVAFFLRGHVPVPRLLLLPRKWPTRR